MLLVFLSDADDASPSMTPGQFYEKLVATKRGDRRKVMAYAANWSPECGQQNMDNGREAPNKFKLFLEYAGGRAFSLCDPDYGTQLAAIGVETARKIGRRLIPLRGVPDITTLEVRYGSQVIPADYEKGWAYDAKRVAVILSGDLTLQQEEGAKLTIRFVPTVLANLQNGGTKTIGE